MKNKIEHTQGPWYVGRELSGTGNWPIISNGTKIGVIYSENWGYDDCCIPEKETKANACLIAAAPELLKALLALVGDDGDLLNAENISFARDAIKKAMGGMR